MQNTFIPSTYYDPRPAGPRPGHHTCVGLRKGKPWSCQTGAAIAAIHKHTHIYIYIHTYIHTYIHVCVYSVDIEIYILYYIIYVYICLCMSMVYVSI